ncbi:hypothetical protein C3408_22610 [Candidatus Pantoea alvi]|nr:hypothetical protein C3408_22610 [Pantoea alvi]
MVAADYVLMLVCDCATCTPLAMGARSRAEYTGEDWKECASAAQEDNWWISSDRKSCVAPGHQELSQNGGQRH